ncbi:lysophospholipase L1-like esterase [Curtobacterium luteum]|uniref:Lysophospholipase L1-like esterase n=1 Tax=Curtobacterium luteum TaxID=33881 RepID=A0A8H9KXC8_9MICO|nr:SGNH/GDSL hydrolase family protein [Curtobacterium luteum]MBM7802316.1 lysophospholipase L1-like esterase [Curtobacterium luteum]NUU52420.1 SGNH/GDSL hydrolase family protein [Curtobacterium luteum]GGK91887.1 hypothetical protein GCM10009769_07520 [Curtobacterium luteum]
MPRPVRIVLVGLVLAALASGVTGCSSDVGAVLPPGTRAGAARVAGPRVVVIGDSITIGHGLRRDQAWPELLAAADRLRLTDLGCDGAGVLAEGSDECSATDEELAEQAAALHPDVVVLQASSNDLGQDDDELAGASEQLVAEVHRLLPRARIVGISAVWDQDAPPAQLGTISTVLRTAVTGIGGAWLDLGQPFRGHPAWMQSDDVHPTARGQRALLAAVTGALRRDHLRW